MKIPRDDAARRSEVPAPSYCTVGATLARMEVWTEAEWRDRDASTPPIEAAHVPGVGWVVALPVLSLN